MIRHALVLPGGPKWPDLKACAAKSITRLYYLATDQQVDAAFFDAVRKSATNSGGVEVGFMYGPNWNDYPSPEIVAQSMDYWLRHFGADAKQMAVMLDQEKHDAAYTLAILQEWRKLRLTRPTVWTLEGHQDWVDKPLADFINADPNLMVLPQLYTGTDGSIDQPIEGGAEIRRYAMSRANGGLGVFPSRVLGFHSPRWRLPAWWEGCLFLESWAQLENA